MKEYVKDNTVTAIVFGVSTLIIVFTMICQREALSKEVESDSLYNLLTVNTIFSGFLYSMLGNMVEFNSRKEIQEKDTAGYVDKYYSPVYFGLFYLITAILLEILILFFHVTLLLKYLLFIQEAFSLVGIVYFVISTLMLRKMINKVRKK
ncbi:hypothetical protein [Candidatus Enterococcus ikei]|uniref:Uncharacterized protein n=1 Tax=Candidatus Enterococcus ikei TaxID=2815326 RepID=A0ABS3GWE3_9ENTE|nr:hypothetical protein [Enterococcus sp. DIV0869a]MBO0439587.1 hypothetical protein [Enterococcus sp. DIV0869a]